MHGSYYVSDNRGAVSIVTPELVKFDVVDNENIIIFQCDFQFTKFYHVPLNTIANIINSFPKDLVILLRAYLKPYLLTMLVLVMI